jgi:two-component system response regulator HydG
MSELIHGILGVSRSIEAVRDYIPKVAVSGAPVLITGETGTGKERIAESIHGMSRRRTGPFVAINCAALPHALFESEFFGHERGAFTGAVTARPGLAAAAHDGTLFLDEIGELDMMSQAKLLRFLESGQIDRLGSTRRAVSDVRVVAATNRYLEDLIDERTFRADLYYRLNVARIEVAPLRDRPEDIPVLIERFIEEMNDRLGRNVGPPDAELIECLAGHDWPGNVRELRNFVEAVFIDPPEGRLRVTHLPPAFRRLLAEQHRTVPDERDALILALKQTNWNKAEAARILKMSRMSIYRKIAKYDIERDG